MLKDMGGSYPGAVPLTMEEYLSLDDGQVASDMAKYHVIKGYELTTKFIQPNSTLPFVHLPTNRNNSEIVAFVDYRSHSMCVHKDCVEAHTQDEFGCGQQVAWNKCEEDWMNDAGLFSRRELGYCEISCGKCEKTAEQRGSLPTSMQTWTYGGVADIFRNGIPVFRILVHQCLSFPYRYSPLPAII